MPDPRPLTLPQVAAAAAVQYRTLHAWVQRGLLVPSIQSSNGSGSPNLFTLRDAVTARVLADLRKAGLGLDQLDGVAQELRERDFASADDDDVLVVNGEVKTLSAGEHIARALESREPTTLYCIGWATASVRPPT